MKHTHRPLLPSAQRLQRLSLWLALTVAWFAAHVLTHVAPRAARGMLAQYARDARLLLVIRAAKEIAFRRGLVHADMRRLACRAAAGGVLRRALCKGPLSQRARTLCTALAAPERWIARIAKRLQRGFTKLRRVPAPRRTRAEALAQAPRAASVINSS